MPERPAIALRRLTLGWQHFDNNGLFQISSRSAHWTARLSGSISGEISSVIANNVAGLSGNLTLEFPDSPGVTKLENYHLTLSVAGANTSGNNTSIKALSLIGSLLSVPPPLLAHYRFDEASAGTTPDAVGSAFATLGDRVAINTTPGLARVGSGVLELNGGDTTTDSPASGAVTSNSFDWTNSARTVTFWWRAKNPNVNTTQGTYLSSGSSAGAGTRFDIKEHSSSNSSLRVEIQSHFSNSNPANFDNGNWRFVAVVVPRNATLADVSWFIDGGTINFNTSTNLFPVITGTGPIVFGDSIVGSDHVPNGYLDDLQVYGDALDASQIAALYQNPGATLAPPEFTFADWTAAFGIAPGESGFLDDPDQDGVANGIDAWFGTHPGQPTTGLHSFTRSGLQFTFRHPHNPHPPSGLAASYQWSPDLTHWYNSGSGPDGGNIVIFTTADSGPDTLVTATAGNPDSTLFFRLRVTISEP